MAPMRTPPSSVLSMSPSGKALMSTTCLGRSTFSFIRSTSVVPPARKRTSACCCGDVPDTPARMASCSDCTRVSWKVSIAASAFTNVLNGSNDVGICAAATDVAAHGFAHIRIGRSTGLVEQCHAGHDLPGGAVTALIAVEFHEGSLHGMHG